MKLYSVLSEYYEEVFPNEREYLDFVLSLIPKDKTNITVLDIGCATGNMSIELAKRDIQTFSFDLNKIMIEKAQKKKQNNLLKEYPIFSVLDMRDIGKAFKNDFFDIITCFGNTLVHINNSDIDKLFNDIKMKLKHNGIFCLQILNYDFIIKNNIYGFPIINTKNVIFKRYNKFLYNNKLQFYTELYVKSEEKYYKNKVTLYPISPENLINKLRLNFSDIKIYDDFEFSVFSDKVLPLVVIAK